jgi:hypothetical protein
MPSSAHWTSESIFIKSIAVAALKTTTVRGRHDCRKTSDAGRGWSVRLNSAIPFDRSAPVFLREYF